MTIEERLQNLERENRRLKRIVAGFGILVTGVVVVAANNSPSPQDTVTAKYLRIVDNAGRERLSLLTDPRTSGPMLLMFDEQKHATVTITGLELSTGVAFQHGGNQAYLGMLEGQPNMMLAGPGGQQIVRAALEERGPRVQIGAKEIPVIQLAAYEGVPTIGMSDTNSIQRVLLSVAGGTGLIAVMGKNAQRGANVTLTADEQLATAEATDRFGGFAQLGAAQEAEPNVALTIYDKDGTPKWSTRNQASR
jgi:hypothetical protein